MTPAGSFSLGPVSGVGLYPGGVDFLLHLGGVLLLHLGEVDVGLGHCGSGQQFFSLLLPYFSCTETFSKDVLYVFCWWRILGSARTQATVSTTTRL